MKNLIFTLGLCLLAASAAIGQVAPQAEPGGNTCSCEAPFCSASQTCPPGQSCYCPCGVVFCKCKPCSASGHTVQVSSEQAANRIEFIALLRSFASRTADEGAAAIEAAYRALAANDVRTYEAKGAEAENKLKLLSASQKTAVTNWFASKGFDFRF
jgi:hypothetical protein